MSNTDVALALDIAAKHLDDATKFKAALATINRVVDHQTNRVNFGDGIRHTVHPLTCGNDSMHTILFPYWTGTRVVLRCPDCDYEQDNCAGMDEDGANDD